MGITQDVFSIIDGSKTAVLVLATDLDRFYNGQEWFAGDDWQEGQAVQAVHHSGDTVNRVGEIITLSDLHQVHNIDVRITDIRMVNIDQLTEAEVVAIGKSVRVWMGMNLRGWYITIKVIA